MSIGTYFYRMKEKKILSPAEKLLSEKHRRIACEGGPKEIRTKKPETRKYEPWRDG